MKKLFILTIILLNCIVVSAQRSIQDFDTICSQEYIINDLLVRNHSQSLWPVFGICSREITSYYSLLEPYYIEYLYRIDVKTSMSALTWTESFYYNDLQELVYYKYTSNDVEGDTVLISYTINNKTLEIIEQINSNALIDNYFFEGSNNYSVAKLSSQKYLNLVCQLWGTTTMAKRTQEIKTMYYKTNANISKYKSENNVIEDPMEHGVVSFISNSPDQYVKIYSRLQLGDTITTKEWYFDEFHNLYFAFYTKENIKDNTKEENRYYFLNGYLYKITDPNKKENGMFSNNLNFFMVGSKIKLEVEDLIYYYYKK